MCKRIYLLLLLALVRLIIFYLLFAYYFPLKVKFAPWLTDLGATSSSLLCTGRIFTLSLSSSSSNYMVFFEEALIFWCSSVM